MPQIANGKGLFPQPTQPWKEANVRSEKRQIKYFVMLHEGLWKVRRDGKFYGPFRGRDAAIACAVDAAQTSGKNDRAAQVLIQAEDGEFQAEWTYGDDIYSPLGQRPLSPW